MCYPFLRSTTLLDSPELLNVKNRRLTDDGVTSRQYAVDYPIKQYSIWEKSGHDLPDEATESSSLRRKIRRAVEDKLEWISAGDTALTLQNPLT